MTVGGRGHRHTCKTQTETHTDINTPVELAWFLIKAPVGNVFSNEDTAGVNGLPREH